jgi:NADH-quinone oxidoreductase subunit C
MPADGRGPSIRCFTAPEKGPADEHDSKIAEFRRKLAMNKALQELGEYIKSSRPEAVLEITQDHDEAILICKIDHIVSLLTFMRDDANCLFKILSDICGVDYPDRVERFDVVYNLLSTRHNQRFRVKVRCNEDELVPSVTSVFSAAAWFEREAYDLFGILFSDHPDMRRLLTDYGFDGHPLRKDFPLTGHFQVRYDEAQKRVVREPVKLSQAFRSFDFLSPWEGIDYVFPGDEKSDPDAI